MTAAEEAAVRVPIAKLARTLKIPADRLAYLADVPDADLVEFRRRVGDMLFQSQRRRLANIAAAAKVLPAPIIAKLVQVKPNPLLSASVAGVIDAGHAVEVAKRLPPAYLAQVATHLDPTRSARIIGKLPTKTIVAVAREVERRRDWLSLGDLVGTISDDAAAATIAALDSRSILAAIRTADDQESLARFASLLSESTLTEVLSTAADNDLWDELSPLLRNLPATAVATTRAAAAKLPGAARDRVLAELETT